MLETENLHCSLMSHQMLGKSHLASQQGPRQQTAGAGPRTPWAAIRENGRLKWKGWPPLKTSRREIMLWTHSLPLFGIKCQPKIRFLKLKGRCMPCPTGFHPNQIHRHNGLCVIYVPKRTLSFLSLQHSPTSKLIFLSSTVSSKTQSVVWPLNYFLFFFKTQQGRLWTF